MDDGWDVDLYLQVEHVIPCHGLADLEEILLSAAIEIINEEAARVPIIVRVIEYLELDEGRLASLYCSAVLVFGTTFLVRYVLNLCQVFDRSALLCTKHPRQPA